MKGAYDEALKMLGIKSRTPVRYGTNHTPRRYNVTNRTKVTFQATHQEARPITTTGFRQNRHPARVDEILATADGRQAPFPLAKTNGIIHTFPAVWADWLGNPGGGGAYGRVFFLKYSGEVYKMLNQARRDAKFLVNNKTLWHGTQIVLKVAADVISSNAKAPAGEASSQNGTYKFVQDSVREAVYHAMLNNAPCLKMPQLMKSTCPDAVVPTLYWAGMINDVKTGYRFYLTVMSRVVGVTVGEYIGEMRYNNRLNTYGYASVPLGKMTPELYVAIERAIALLWMQGIAHADFHLGNQMYDPATGKITIIDFGQVVNLREPLTAKVRQMIPTAIGAGVKSLADLWRPASESEHGLNIQSHVDQVRFGRNSLGRFHPQERWYNPDDHVLQTLYNRLTTAQKKAVPNLRGKAWGYNIVGNIKENWYQ